MGQAERYFLLMQTDSLWKDHLQAIKFLQQAVGLRGYAQKDPLTEYKLEGYNLFLEMMAQIRRRVAELQASVLLHPGGCRRRLPLPRSNRRNVIFNVYSFQPTKVSKADGVTPASVGGKN